MATETSFLLQAMDLLDDGRCPTDRLGNSAWGRLIAAGRELLDETPDAEKARNLWSNRVPSIPDHYWFHGKLHESDSKPLTRTVRVIDSGQLRPVYLCEGQIIYPFDSWGLCQMPGLWQKAHVPELPTPAESEKKADG